MKQKIILSVAILSLLSLAVFVSAQDCTDSDNGIDYYTKGYIGGKNDYDDHCAIGSLGCKYKNISDENCLREYYCENNIQSASEFYSCPNGCKDGACIPAPGEACTDSDNGIDYYTKGYIGGKNDYDDHCAIGSLGCKYKNISDENCLREYYCENNIQSASEFYSCPNGCEEGACIKTIPQEDKPVEIPEIVEEEQEKLICYGCPLDKKCYPFGYREESKYCSDEQEFTTQKEADTPCNNNFECSTNLCIDNECVSSGFWQKIMRFFKNLFG